MNASELQKFLSAIFCISTIDFMNMYNDLGFSDSYALGEYDRMRDDFILWACSIDEITMNKIINWITNHPRVDL